MTAVALVLFFAGNAEELYRRGVEAFQGGQRDEAVRALTEASKLAPRNAQIWKVLGVVYASAEDFERAAAPFERACSLDSKLVDACYYHGRNLYALNRFNRSLEALRKALPNDRSPWRVHLGIAQALEALGQAEEAEREFQTAIRRMEDPHPDFDPRLHYAVFLFRQGRTREAAVPAKAAVQAHPGSARAHFEMGRIQYHLGELPGAVEHLQQAAKLGYAPAQPLLAKARARFSAGSAAPPN